MQPCLRRLLPRDSQGLAGGGTMENTWTMEEAKNDFTAIAEAVYAGKPQYVTNHSHPDLVITTKSRVERTEQEEDNKRFVEFLLSIPKEEAFIEENEERNIPLRDIEF